MGIDNHFVVETIDGIVQRGVVESDLDEVRDDPVMAENGVDSAGDTAADLVFVVAGCELPAARVAEQQTDPDARFGPLADGGNPLRVFFGEEQAGKGQEINTAFGLAKQVGPQMVGYVATARVGGDKLDTGQSAAVGCLGPQVALVLAQEFRHAEPGAWVGDAAPGQPPFDRFRADLGGFSQ